MYCCAQTSQIQLSGGWLWRLQLQLKSLINLVLQRIPGRQRFSIWDRYFWGFTRKGDLQVSMIDTTNLKDIIYTDLDLDFEWQWRSSYMVSIQLANIIIFYTKGRQNASYFINNLWIDESLDNCFKDCEVIAFCELQNPTNNFSGAWLIIASDLPWKTLLHIKNHQNHQNKMTFKSCLNAKSISWSNLRLHSASLAVEKGRERIYREWWGWTGCRIWGSRSRCLLSS